jgi:hypothetical protein
MCADDSSICYAIVRTNYAYMARGCCFVNTVTMRHHDALIISKHKEGSKYSNFQRAISLPDSGLVSGTLGKAPITLGKGFAECNTLQRALGSDYVGNDIFAECLLLGTRQRLCRVSGTALGKKVAVTAFGAVTASLPSALELALGKY